MQHLVCYTSYENNNQKTAAAQQHYKNNNNIKLPQKTHTDTQYKNNSHHKITVIP